MYRSACRTSGKGVKQEALATHNAPCMYVRHTVKMDRHPMRTRVVVVLVIHAFKIPQMVKLLAEIQRLCSLGTLIADERRSLATSVCLYSISDCFHSQNLDINIMVINTAHLYSFVCSKDNYEILGRFVTPE